MRRSFNGYSTNVSVSITPLQPCQHNVIIIVKRAMLLQLQLRHRRGDGDTAILLLRLQLMY